GVAPRTREAIARLFSGSIDLPPLAAQMFFFPPYAIGQAILLGEDLVEALNGLKQASSVFTLAPTRRKIDQHLDPAAVAGSGVELRLVTVSLDSGAIRYVRQDGHVIETDGRPVVGPNPTVCRSERNAYNAAVTARDAAGHALHEDESAELRHEYEEAKAAA